MRCPGWVALVLAALAAGSGAPGEDETEALFRSGLEAYQAGDAARAAERWEKLLRFRIRSAALEKNLGDAYHRLGRPGPAVLHWERALLIDPRDERARRNLERARESLVDPAAPDPGPVGLLVQRVEILSEAQDMAWTVLVLWLALGFGAAGAIVAGGRLARASLLASVVSVLALAVAVPAFWLQLRHQEGRSRFVVMVPAVEVRAGPGAGYQAQILVHEGLVVRSRGGSAGFQEVELPNGTRGWIEAGALERI